MTLFLYVLTFYLAVARPELGLLILTFALASVGKAWGHTAIQGVGSLQISDFATLGLAFSLVCNPRSWRSPKYVIWFLIVFWICAIALFHGFSRPDGIKLAYDLIARYGLLWLIPIIVVELTPKKRRILVLGMLLCGVFVTGIQAYTYIKRDPSFATKMYFQFQESPAYNMPERDAVREFHINPFPRLYPLGALMVQALMMFVLVNYLLSYRPNWPHWLMASLFLLYGVFFLSLRQRSSAIGLAVALCLFFTCPQAGNRGLRTAVRTIVIVTAAIVAVLVYQAATGARFFDDFQNRFDNERIVEQHNRVHDDWLAFNAIWGSPLIGTASFDVESLAAADGGQSLGLDVHPVLAIAVLGGLPLLVLIAIATWQCGKRCWFILAHAGAENQSIAAAISIAYMFCVAILSFAGVFTLVKDMLPMLLFVGIVESATIAEVRQYVLSSQSKPYREPPFYHDVPDESVLRGME